MFKKTILILILSSLYGCAHNLTAPCNGKSRFFAMNIGDIPCDDAQPINTLY